MSVFLHLMYSTFSSSTTPFYTLQYDPNSPIILGIYILNRTVPHFATLEKAQSP